MCTSPRALTTISTSQPHSCSADRLAAFVAPFLLPMLTASLRLSRVPRRRLPGRRSNWKPLSRSLRRPGCVTSRALMSGALGDHSLSSAARVPATTLVCAGVHPRVRPRGLLRRLPSGSVRCARWVARSRCPIALSDGLFGETGRSAPSRVRPLPRVEIVDIKFDPEGVDLHEERVSVRNTCKAPVSLESWRRMTWSVTSGADRSPRHRSAHGHRRCQCPAGLVDVTTRAESPRVVRRLRVLSLRPRRGRLCERNAGLRRRRV
jgi:hypothetical protein